MDFIWTEYSVSQFGGTYSPIGPFFVEYMNSSAGFGPFALWIKPNSGPLHHLCKRFAVIWPSSGLLDFLFLARFHIGSATAHTSLYLSLPLITRPDQMCWLESNVLLKANCVFCLAFFIVNALVAFISLLCSILPVLYELYGSKWFDGRH